MAAGAAARPAGALRGWRGLGAFWAAMILAAGAGGGLLGWLGPLPPPAEAPLAEAPRAEAPPVPPPLAEPPTAAAPPAAPAPAPPAPSPIAEPFRPPGQPGRPIPASEPALLENGPHGPLPRLGPENRSSIRAYGRPFDRADPRPRLGLIVGGLGMAGAVTEEAIRRLPGTVTLAFSPYAPRIGPLLDQARAKGMELLVALPLEPTGYPLNNPGNRALLTGLPPAEIEDRLDWLLSRFTGYVGGIGALGPMRGERFALLTSMLNALQATLHGRGLLYIDPRVGAKSPEQAWGRTVDLVVDEPATRSEIERKLAQLERLAQENGSALGYAGEASPVLVDRLAAWANSVEQRGFALAPVTAMIRRPEAAEPVRAR